MLIISPSLYCELIGIWLQELQDTNTKSESRDNKYILNFNMAYDILLQIASYM